MCVVNIVYLRSLYIFAQNYNSYAKTKFYIAISDTIS